MAHHVHSLGLNTWKVTPLMDASRGEGGELSFDNGSCLLGVWHQDSWVSSHYSTNEPSRKFVSVNASCVAPRNFLCVTKPLKGTW